MYNYHTDPEAISTGAQLKVKDRREVTVGTETKNKLK